MEKKIICITGPSGSGKTTIATLLKEAGIPELTSHTTRTQRKGEVDGEAYHFVTEEEFLLTDKVESSRYAGNYYGLSKAEVERKLLVSDVVVLVTDIHGMHQVKTMYPGITKSVFLEVTMEEMEERMLGRGDSRENIGVRLENARTDKELMNGQHCDYVVRNKVLDRAVVSVLKIAREEEC